MFIGYAMDHDGNCYRMWNPTTDGVHVTCNIIWIWRMFYNKPNKEGIIRQLLLVEDADRDREIEDNKNNNDPGADDSSAWEGEVDGDDQNAAADNRTVSLNDLDPKSQKTSRSGRMIRNPARLIEEIGAMEAKVPS
jgi:hypothetical protein